MRRCVYSLLFPSIARNKPAKSLNTVEFKIGSGSRRVLSKLRATIRKTHYRNDLKNGALRKASALIRGQKAKSAPAAAKKSTKKAE